MSGDRIAFWERVGRTRENTQRCLLAACGTDGLWSGRLSSSPLATAVAIVALHTVDAAAHAASIQNGAAWLAAHQNADGGWGDTENCDPSNLSTTLLALAALCAIDGDGRYAAASTQGHAWLKSRLHYDHEADLVEAIYAAYGDDRTFAVPILTHCTLAGLFQKTTDPWRFVKALPFELAQLPRALYRVLNLTVVSYALPALIAVGQAKFHFDPPQNAVVRAVRRRACRPTLRLLETIQPTHGGFLDAPPLTGFVTMSLAAIGQQAHPVVERGVEFLTATMRPDGSWPIDTTLSTWLTTHAAKILGTEDFHAPPRHLLTQSLLKQQYKTVHPFTGAAPGGWGWNGLPGAVPDADDTAGALAALHRLGICCDNTQQAARAGLRWMLDLQNADGGMPTFCRGWGKLEFDRSCADITAHAIEAFVLWRDRVEEVLKRRIESAIRRGLTYIYAHQRADGAWLPLWFGNPTAVDQRNPVYGTARVLSILGTLDGDEYPIVAAMIPRAASFLTGVQQRDGGWGSIEETGLAVTALAGVMQQHAAAPQAIGDGLDYLIGATREGTFFPPAPIGLYFAKLWYTEDLYPVLFSCEAFKAVQDSPVYSGP